MATPDEIRAAGIRKDVFARHGIPEGTDDVTALEMIQSQSEGAWGAQPSAWANPDERAGAREQYARKGKTPQDVQKRWDESIYLMDPQTQDYSQNYLRDMDFLEGMLKADSGVEDPEITAWTGKTTNPQGLAEYRVGEAVGSWDASNSSPLYRKDWRRGTYASYGGGAGATSNAMLNPDTASGAYLPFSELFPNTLRMQGSGESDSLSESARTAAGHYLANKRFRPSSPAPVLDLPSSATPAERAARIKELRDLTASAAIPQADERWKRTTGYVPPGWVQDVGDGLISTFDPTFAVTGANVAKSLAKPALKAASIAGQGWSKPYVLGAAKQATTSLGWDQAGEQAAGAALLGSTGGQEGRTYGQYAFGGGEPTQMKSPQQVEGAKQARGELFQASNDAGSVSTSNDAAYKRLQDDNLVPIQVGGMVARPEMFLLDRLLK
jgi:hypothetical protein